MKINDFIDEAIHEIRKDPNKYFLENYVYKHGSKEFVALTIPEDDDFVYCLYACHFIISKISYKGTDLFLIQVKDEFTNGDRENLNMIKSHFNVKEFTVKPHKIEWKYDLVCDSMYTHQPVNTFGMLCEITFSRTFKRKAI